MPNLQAKTRTKPGKQSLEQRVTAVENAVEELKNLLTHRQPDPNWLQKLIGSMNDEPLFDEVVKLGRQYRKAGRIPKSRKSRTK